MTTQEFSNSFDVLTSSYSLRPEFGLTDPLAFNEYEKSLFLSLAQEQIVIELYTGKYEGDSFERTEELRRYLSNLVKTYETHDKLVGHLGLSKTSTFFKIPDDVWFITYESAILKDARLGCEDGSEAIIVPVSQDDYFRISMNPFRGPSGSRVLRLDLKDNTIEMVSEYNIEKYLIRYLSKPEPIVVANLSGVSVDGVSTINECKLDEPLHRVILERGVRLGLVSKSLYSNNK